MKNINVKLTYNRMSKEGLKNFVFSVIEAYNNIETNNTKETKKAG